jgi:hypothetical protein
VTARTLPPDPADIQAAGGADHEHAAQSRATSGAADVRTKPWRTVAGERCSTCGKERTGSFRYCLTCGFDFEPETAQRSQPEFAPDGGKTRAAAAVAVPPVLRDASRDAADPVRPLIPVGPKRPESLPNAPALGVSGAVAVAACPYLGLVDDPETHFMFATPGHRCRVESTPAKISLPHQGSYCLTTEHTACPIFPGAPPSEGHYLPPGSSADSGAGRARGIAALVLVLLVLAAIWVLQTQRQASPSGSNAESSVTANSPISSGGTVHPWFMTTRLLV